MRFGHLLIVLFFAIGARAAQFEFKNYPNELEGNCAISDSNSKTFSKAYLTLVQQGNRRLYRLEIGQQVGGFTEIIDRDIRTETSRGVRILKAGVKVDTYGFVTRQAQEYFENTCDQAFSEKIAFSGGVKDVNVELFRSISHFTSRDKFGKEICSHYSNKVKCYFDGTLRNSPYPWPIQ